MWLALVWFVPGLVAAGYLVWRNWYEGSHLIIKDLPIPLVSVVLGPIAAVGASVHDL